MNNRLQIEGIPKKLATLSTLYPSKIMTYTDYLKRDLSPEETLLVHNFANYLAKQRHLISQELNQKNYENLTALLAKINDEASKLNHCLCVRDWK